MIDDNSKENKLVMKGVLSVLSLPQLIQTIDTNKKVMIVLKPEKQKAGTLYFSDGKIVHASIGDTILGKKAFFKMMNWLDIPFELFELARFSKSKEPNISLDTFELIMEGTRQVDEIQQIEKKLPLYYKLKPSENKLTDLTEEEKMIVDSLGSGKFVKDILNISDDEDLTIYRLLVSLYEKQAISSLRIKVLIIDDNRFFANIINDVVDKLFKTLFTTFIVDNGEKGIEIIEGENKPDLVISDLLMEGKDGFDVLESAKKFNIPIIILTSERRESENIIGLGAEFMHKSVLGSDDFPEIFKNVLFKILVQDC
jgi:CheY-like chemotaxis protein